MEMTDPTLLAYSWMEGLEDGRITTVWTSMTGMATVMRIETSRSVCSQYDTLSGTTGCS